MAAADQPGELASHFQSRKYATSAWSELWDTDRTGFWDRGKPSPALIDLLESGNEVVWFPASRGRPKALVPGCGKGYDVVMLALHGFDAFGIEVSATAAGIARQYAAAELAAPSAHNYGSAGAATSPADGPGPGTVTIIAADFFERGWQPDGVAGFDLVYDYTFLCALHPSMRRAWARRMHELVRADGVLVCLEFPLLKDLRQLGPPWGLNGVHWHLLAAGGDGVLDEPGEETDAETDAATPSHKGPFTRLLRFKPARSYEAGRGSDMVSVWRTAPYDFGGEAAV